MDSTKLKDRMSDKLAGLEQPAPTDTALATISSNYVALNGNVLEIIRGNLKNQALTLDLFDIVKSPGPEFSV